jgi:hypothetical protein
MKRFWLLPLLLLAAIDRLDADSQIAEVQERLKARGLYSGEINGEDNNETAAALTRFQARSGIEVTGRLNEETLRLLGVESSQPFERGTEDHSRPKIEAWRALREQDRRFLEQMTSAEETAVTREQMLEPTQIQDFIAGFVVAGISEDVEAELQFYAEKADYYDSGIVSKDFIRKDILRYNQKWPIRRYWLDGDISILNGLEADPIEVQYQIRYVVENPQKESSGTAVKTLKLKKAGHGLEITFVREKTLN